MHLTAAIADESASPVRTDSDVPPALRVRAYPAWLRIAAAVLKAIAGLALLREAALYVLASIRGDLVPPGLILAARLVLYSLVPWLVSWLLGRLATGTIRVEPTRLVLELRRASFEIPLASVAELRPWRLPLPGPGLTLRMTSGNRFQYGLSLPDPSALLTPLAEANHAGAPSVLGHPAIAWARARSAVERRWYHLLLKFGLFPTPLALIFFRLHQFIAYGGPFGQYQMYGLKPYLLTLLDFLLKTISMLVLYASVWRALAEVAAISVTWLAPSRAHGARRFAEIACRIICYVGVPLLVAERFL